MNVIVVIDGREAIPVRAIPYVSGWEIGPDELAEQFARTIGAPFARLRNTSAHHLHDGLPVKVLPKEWDGVVVRLAALESSLRSQFSDDKQGYDAWREASVQRLPAGVFVWLDEFSMDFQADLSPDRITLIREREEERDLVLTPMLDSATGAVVMAGFEPVVSGYELHAVTAQQAASPPAPVVEAPASDTPQWKMRIQIEAAAHMKRLRAANASPTVHSIIDDMARWCRANEVKTDGGIFPSANYLRTHVLGGRHWTPPR